MTSLVFLSALVLLAGCIVAAVVSVMTDDGGDSNDDWDCHP